MKDHRTAILTDEQALLALQELLSGKEWDSDTLMTIAEILDNAGYEIAPVPHEPMSDANMEPRRDSMGARLDGLGDFIKRNPDAFDPV